MARLKGLIVHVTVNNQNLPEYEDDEQGEDGAEKDTNYRDGDDGNEFDEDPSPKKITKYVEAIGGAEFEVAFECEQHYSYYGGTGMSFVVSLDGEVMDNVVIRGDSFKAILNGARKADKDMWTVKKFKFSDILITENRSTSKDLNKLVDRLGVITVNVARVDNIRESVVSRNYGHSDRLISQPISEKLLKGRSLSLRSSLGAPQAMPKVNILNCDYLDPTNAPYAVFNFKYRSRKSLQDMCIIPRSPTSLPLEERPRNQLTREELLELLNRRTATVKPEIKPESTPRSGVKRERDSEYEELVASAKSKKTCAKQDIEVIDLLDD